VIKLGKKALKLLARVADHIEEEPRRFIMDIGYDDGDDGAPCGTAACIGGWLVLLADKKWKMQENWWGAVGSRALELLAGSTPIWKRFPNFDRYSFPLFHVEEWPNEYKYKYDFEGDSLITKETPKGERKRVLSARKRNGTLAVKLLHEVIERGGIWWVDADA
jgi:hypothetical protein